MILKITNTVYYIQVDAIFKVPFICYLKYSQKGYIIDKLTL